MRGSLRECDNLIPSTQSHVLVRRGGWRRPIGIWKQPMTDQTPQSEMILYQTEDGWTRIQCRFENELSGNSGTLPTSGIACRDGVCLRRKSACFVSRFCPNGARLDSPGRSPGLRNDQHRQAPTGRDSTERSLEFRPVGASGRAGSCPRAAPRAAPWAFELRPFGPESRKQILFEFAEAEPGGLATIKSYLIVRSEGHLSGQLATLRNFPIVQIAGVDSP